MSEIRHSVLNLGKAVGAHVTRVGDDGELHCLYEYELRGATMKRESRIALGAAGLPTSIENVGVDFHQAELRERFSVVDGKAVWHNPPAEQGEAEWKGDAFYLSLHRVPEEEYRLARALLAAPRHTLPLLPSGEARIERAGELAVEAAGVSRTVVLYEMHGIELGPIPIWLDTEGGFFALSYGWLAVILAGWEATIPRLLEEERQAETAYFSSLAVAAPAAALAITAARLFDSERGETVEGMTVVVSGGRIVAVGADGTVAIPPHASVIGARGRSLLPGLWDMHAHLREVEGPLHLAAGVTTARDMGNDIERVTGLRQRFDAGLAAGPRLILAGWMEGVDPKAAPIQLRVDTEEQARAAVARYAELGFEHIKIYSSIKPELVPFLCREARRHGLRFSGHVPAFMSATDAVRAGFQEIQHAIFLLLNFWSDEVPDARAGVATATVGARAAQLDLDSAPVQEFIGLLKERDVVVDANLARYEFEFTARPGAMAEGYAPIAHRLPPPLRRFYLGGGLPVPEGLEQRYRDAFSVMLELQGRLFAAGVPMVAGTDALPGFTLHRELELYVKAGIPAPVVLQMATLDAARLMKRDAELGSLVPGKLADLVLVDGDPSRRISDIRKVDMTVKGGVVYWPGELYKAVGVLS